MREYSRSTARLRAILEYADATTTYHVLNNLVAFPHGQVGGSEEREPSRNSFSVDRVIRRFHRIEEGSKLPLLQPAHISNLNLTLIRFWDPKGMAVAHRKELVGVDVPGSGAHDE